MTIQNPVAEQKKEATPSQGAVTVTTQQESQIVLQAREISKRIRFMIVNGNKLKDDEVYALAHFSAANDLNPFAGEAYYLPGIGAIPGIAGWRKKANEQLMWEAEKEGLHGAHFWIEWRQAKPEEAVFTPGRDYAWHCTLHDYLSNKRWRESIFQTARELKQFGWEGKEAMTEATRMVGEEPVWTAVGVVLADESFGGKEKFDRNERAKKRAEKQAIRKRFQQINLPDKGDAGDEYEEGDIRIIEEEEARRLQEPMSDRDKSIAADALGLSESDLPKSARKETATGTQEQLDL